MTADQPGSFDVSRILETLKCCLDSFRFMSLRAPTQNESGSISLHLV
jgi:hypothetical protein